MKKLLPAFCLLLVMLLVMAMAAGAAEVEDPLVIDSRIFARDELEAIGADIEDKAFRVYLVDMVSAFAEFESIERVITEHADAAPVCAVVSKEGLMRVFGLDQSGRPKPGEMPEMCERIAEYPKAIDEMLLRNSFFNAFPQPNRLETAYYLQAGTHPEDGAAIYFQTDTVECVYYDINAVGEFLMPLETFVSYMRLISEARENASAPEEISVWSAAERLAPFNIHSETFDFNASISQEPVVPAAPAVLEDFQKVPEELVRKLRAQGADLILPVCRCDLPDAFARNQSIERVMEDKNTIFDYYAIKYRDGTVVYRMLDDDGKPVDVERGWFNLKAFQSFEKNEVIKRVSPDITVQKAYYLSGEIFKTGTAIYYKTDKGDYVYFAYYGNPAPDYLFPAEAFFEFEKAFREEQLRTGDLDIGAPDISGIRGISSFDLNSDSFDLNAPVPGSAPAGDYGVPAELLVVLGVVLAAAAAAGGVWAAKRKKRTQ